MKMLTSVVYFAFAYCGAFGVLLASLGRHRSAARLRMAVPSLRLDGLAPSAGSACMEIADIAALGDRNDPAAIDAADTLQDFERRRRLQRGQVHQRRDRRRGRRCTYRIGRPAAVAPFSVRGVRTSVIAIQRVRAQRGPMTGYAKQARAESPATAALNFFVAEFLAMTAKEIGGCVPPK
jgi:hypothetical protein